MAEPLPDALEIHINRPFLAPLPSFDYSQVFEGELGNWLHGFESRPLRHVVVF